MLLKTVIAIISAILLFAPAASTGAQEKLSKEEAEKKVIEILNEHKPKYMAMSEWMNERGYLHESSKYEFYPAGPTGMAKLKATCLFISPEFKSDPERYWDLNIEERIEKYFSLRLIELYEEIPELDESVFDVYIPRVVNEEGKRKVEILKWCSFTFTRKLYNLVISREDWRTYFPALFFDIVNVDVYENMPEILHQKATFQQKAQ